jgi:prepilin-type N-terminal cleavage/methylation domain-containing protein
MQMSRPRGGRLAGAAGFTLIELLIVIVIVGLLASLAMAAYRSARVRAHEVTTIAALRTINDAQYAFAQTCGNQRFAPSLAALGTPVPTTGRGFLSPDLAIDPVVGHGYQVVMTATPLTDGTLSCLNEAPAAGYFLTADPLVPGISGVRFFGTNSDRALFEDSATFVGTMPETGAPGHGSELRAP